MKRLVDLTEPYARNFVGLWHSRVGLAAGLVLLVPAGAFILMRQYGSGPSEFVAASLVVAIICCATVLIDIVQATTRYLVGRKARRE